MLLRMLTTLVARAIGCVVALTAAGPLSAQTTGMLTGKVTSADGTPLPQAQLTVRGTALIAVAGADGHFTIRGVPSPSLTLDVRMLGYQPRALALEIGPGDTHVVDVVLTAIPLGLDTVAVSADAHVSPAMRAFEQRRARGPGVFFDREAIQRLQPRVFTDVLRRVPGLQVRPVRGGLGGTNFSVQTRGSECSVLFFLNGTTFPVPPDQPINDFVSPEEVIGVEVYSGSSEIPAQFNSSRFNSRCGVIVIWTRYGPERDRRR